MVRTKYFVIDILMEEERAKGPRTPQQMEEYRAKLERTIGYGDLGHIALGKFCEYLIDFAVWFTQLLTIVAYFIFLANTIYTLFPLRPAAIPLNNSIPISGDEIDGGIVGNICPISTASGSYYEPRTNIGIPMLNIPSLKQKPAECPSSNGHGQESVRHRRAIDYPEISNREIGLNHLDAEISENGQIKFKQQDNNLEYAKQSSTTTTLAPKTTTIAVTIKPNTTVSPNTTTTVPPTPHFFMKSIAPDMKLLFLIPLPFFLCTSLIRELRVLSPLTVVATFALFVGAFSVLGFEISGRNFPCSFPTCMRLIKSCHNFAL